MSPYSKLLKFGIVGIIATAIHILVASWLIEGFVSSSVPIANIAAVLIAATFSYIGNTKWSFAEPFTRSNGLRFAITASVSCVLAFSISWLADKAGFHYLIGIAFIVTIVPALTFLSHFFWTYRAD